MIRDFLSRSLSKLFHCPHRRLSTVWYKDADGEYRLCQTCGAHVELKLDQVDIRPIGPSRDNKQLLTLRRQQVRKDYQDRKDVAELEKIMGVKRE